MSKLMSSMKSLFGNKRSKESGRPAASHRERDKRKRRSHLEADSFVFVPGDGGPGSYWGEVVTVNGENFPISHLSGEYSQQAAAERRRKTTVGHVIHPDYADQSPRHGGGAATAVLLRPRSKTTLTPEDVLLKNSKVYGRRLSGTLVKNQKTSSAAATDEVEDGSLLLPGYPFVAAVSERDRWSQDVSGRYVYDRLVHVPPSTQKKKMFISDWKLHKSSAPPPPPASRDKELVFKVRRCSSSQQTGGYCDLVPVLSGSEYAMPDDAIDWEDLRIRTFEGTFQAGRRRHLCSPTCWSCSKLVYCVWLQINKAATMLNGCYEL